MTDLVAMVVSGAIVALTVAGAYGVGHDRGVEHGSMAALYELHDLGLLDEDKVGEMTRKETGK